MAISNAAKIWSAKFQVALDKATVFGDLTNSDYEGEVKGKGSSVSLSKFGAVTVSDYSGTITRQAAETTEQVVTIDQAKFYSVKVGAIDEFNGNPSLVAEAARRGAVSMKDAIDTYVAGVMATNAKAGNKLGSTSITSVAAAEDVVYALRAKLNGESVPTDGRFIVLDARTEGFLIRSLLFKDTSDADNVILNGRLGRFAGFEVRGSQNLKVVSTRPTIVAGHPLATTYASGLTMTRVIESVDSFDHVIEGLNCFGAKVIESGALATAEIAST